MRNYNFSAGPSMLPLEVLEKVQSELTDYAGTGMSVMEMSHRSKPYEAINAEAEADLRELMHIPDNYDVIFVQGGASTQFEAVPLNISVNKKADYVVTGNFSNKAYKEAKKYGDMVEAASSADKNFTYIPELDRSMFRPDADYVHICYNNTIFGTRYASVPDTGDIPLVADMSSCILSQEFDVTKFAVIYAGAQKNVGPAGVTIVIVRDDLVREDVLPFTPTIMRYTTQAKAKSLSNTPPAYGIYICGLVFKWLKEMGGLSVMAERNKEKAAILYDYLDQSKLFRGTARKEDRSLMNVPFVTGSDELDALFVAEAKSHGIESIKGHRSVGGMRASIYNAMPKAGVEALVAFMAEFEKNNG